MYFTAMAFTIVEKNGRHQFRCANVFLHNYLLMLAKLRLKLTEHCNALVFFLSVHMSVILSHLNFISRAFEAIST